MSLLMVGFIVGLGIGMTATTLLFGQMLIAANRKAHSDSNEIMDLLRRRTLAAEKMAGIAEGGAE